MALGSVGSFFSKFDCCPSWSYQDRAQAASFIAMICGIVVAAISGSERFYSCKQVNCDPKEYESITDKRENLNNWACVLAAVGAVFAFISFVYLSKCCGRSGSNGGDGSSAGSLPIV